MNALIRRFEELVVENTLLRETNRKLDSEMVGLREEVSDLRGRQGYHAEDLNRANEERARAERMVNELKTELNRLRAMIPLNQLMSGDQIDEVCRNNPTNKIDAIKIVRSRTGLGLKETKDLVEASWLRQGMSYPV